jgi:hypothetical protein
MERGQGIHEYWLALIILVILVPTVHCISLCSHSFQKRKLQKVPFLWVLVCFSADCLPSNDVSAIHYLVRNNTCENRGFFPFSKTVAAE